MQPLPASPPILSPAAAAAAAATAAATAAAAAASAAATAATVDANASAATTAASATDAVAAAATAAAATAATVDANASAATAAASATDAVAAAATAAAAAAAPSVQQTPRFDSKKMLWVVGSLIASLAVAYVIGLLVNGGFKGYGENKTLLYAGLIVAGLGQFAESVSKTSDSKKHPRFLDGVELYAEGLKFLGVLAALLGAVLAIEAP